MRPKVIIIVLASGLLVFGALLAVKSGNSHSAKNAEALPSSSAKEQGNEGAVASQAAESANPSPTNKLASEKSKDSSEDAHKAYVEQRGEQLMGLAMNDDRASLDTILSELTNRDPEIRKAALDATVQFGSRDAIPKLADAASQTDDPNEKAALNDAVEFLKLPSLTEVMAHSPKPAGGQQVAKTGHRVALRRPVLPAPQQPNQ